MPDDQDAVSPEAGHGTIRIEVAYARPDRQVILPLVVPEGTTVDAALRQSEIDAQFPEIDLENAKVGIFGKLTRRDTVLRPKDRIEIYRPLIADPKEVRRQRAGKNRKKPGKGDAQKAGDQASAKPAGEKPEDGAGGGKDSAGD
ncbi:MULTISPECIES: RnfH family protein [unclassified Thioalkalivibrio]|uniref:RnfH family protein n=1 Tax=unclassified Thioalkalivibrio TaxID=2621013 RepID=UPI00037551B9|nr:MULTISPECIES: RnfH family protein [unclassified Thioalkalivibrio]